LKCYLVGNRYYLINSKNVGIQYYPTAQSAYGMSSGILGFSDRRRVFKQSQAVSIPTGMLRDIFGYIFTDFPKNAARNQFDDNFNSLIFDN
jgi:hypothetical protein